MSKVVQVLSNGKTFSAGTPMEQVNNWIQLNIPKVSKFFKELLSIESLSYFQSEKTKRAADIRNKEGDYLSNLAFLKSEISKNKSQILKLLTKNERFAVSLFPHHLSSSISHIKNKFSSEDAEKIMDKFK